MHLDASFFQLHLCACCRLSLQAHGIIGCIRFTTCFYLLLLTKKSFVGSIGGT